MIYITAGHNLNSAKKGNGAFGIEHPTHKGRIDEAVENIWMRDAISDHLRKHGLKVSNDSNTTGLSSVLAWLRSKAGANDWCIEIHFNAGPATASGTECVVPNDHTTTEGAMAQAICRAVNVATSQGGKGIRIRERAPGRKGIVLERETARGRIAFLHSPAVAHNVLAEICFITNKRDVELYFINRKRIARTIAEHIIYHL